MSAGYLAKCSTKIRYTDKERAQAARRARVAQGVWRLNNTNVYRCNVCGGYHIGHLGKSNRGKGR